MHTTEKQIKQINATCAAKELVRETQTPVSVDSHL